MLQWCYVDTVTKVEHMRRKEACDHVLSPFIPLKIRFKARRLTCCSPLIFHQYKICTVYPIGFSMYFHVLELPLIIFAEIEVVTVSHQSLMRLLAVYVLDSLIQCYVMGVKILDACIVV
jgi:hypothetical protein